MMTNEQIMNIFADEAFVKELIAMEDNAAFQAALKEKGIELTDEEVAVIRQLQAKAAAGEITKEQLEDGELPEELLDHVSGGVIGTIVGVLIALGTWGGTLGLAVGMSASRKKKSEYIVTHNENGGCGVSSSW